MFVEVEQIMEAYSYYSWIGSGCLLPCTYINDGCFINVAILWQSHCSCGLCPVVCTSFTEWDV